MFDPPKAARRVFENILFMLEWSRLFSRFHPCQRGPKATQDLEAIGILRLEDGTAYPVTVRIHDVPAGDDLTIPVSAKWVTGDGAAWETLLESLQDTTARFDLTRDPGKGSA